MNISLKQLSKGMAQALRHQPDRFGLDLDEVGWVSAVDLLTGLCREKRWCELSIHDLESVLNMPGKRRYEMKDGRIRALYGHSARVKVQKAATVPPDILYHGTASETAVVILKEGLKPMKRQFVHLAIDRETANLVGQRKDRNPVLLKILAADAHRFGEKFYRGNESTWLAKQVAVRFISID